MLIDEISEIVAKELNISPLQAKAINRIQWKFLLKEMQSGDFNSVQMFYIGKFSKKLNIDDKGKNIVPEFIKEKRKNGSNKGNL